MTLLVRYLTAGKSELSPSQARIIEYICAELMAYYGYEIEQNPGKGIPLKIRVYSILEA